MEYRWLRLLAVLAGAGLVACQSFYPVPLRDGAYPVTAVKAGERVRVETVGGEAATFAVASIDAGGITADTGRHVANGELKSLQVKRLNKRKTFTTLGVIGGIIGTALILDEAEELSDCLEFDDFDACVE